MKETTLNYLDDKFEKIEPPLKSDDKGKVFKARDKITGEFVIIKSIENLVGNVYQLLKKKLQPVFAGNSLLRGR